MAMNRPIQVNEGDFDHQVMKASLPVLVHFGAPWCPPCRELIPILEKIAQEYAGRLLVAEVDSDQNPDLASHYGAGRIPTLLFFSAGRVVRESVGVIPYTSLCQMADSLLESA
jgi:thioredoxin 1